ncbi:hypothetical protein DND132_0360 [Pseudodesulfovibrio mercurii]|uniref:Uncharacterized protein n=1 Tax=Pseudodesulfovibrio mercurii TaxID=641491 RepID=F0JEU2_9BACT|nr:hypothetical protein [Pseudodesulfovibrio mercurii]EGB13577.1 hypothetical protein DND132_0360 [Pseudodesulfovibrio mercurii]
MGQYANFPDHDTLEAQVKSLADDELLDFWEETQQLARMLDQAEQTDLEYNPEYERVILQELQYRTCFKGRI